MSRTSKKKRRAVRPRTRRFSENCKGCGKNTVKHVEIEKTYTKGLGPRQKTFVYKKSSDVCSRCRYVDSSTVKESTEQI